MNTLRLLILLVVAVASSACEREERQFRLDPPVGASLESIATMPNGIAGLVKRLSRR